MGVSRDQAIAELRRREAIAELQRRNAISDQPSDPLGQELATSEGVIPRAPQIAAQRSALDETLRENAPALGATVATLPFGGLGGGVAQAGKFLIPSLARQAGNLVTQSLPGQLATGAARAGIGGAGGAALAGESAEGVAEAAKTQALIDPIAKLTLGLGKFLLRPAGEALGQQATRLVEFARKEGLQVDPGAATDRIVPKLISEFTKNFFGSRVQSRTKMEAIVNHISSDPGNVQAFFKRIIGDVAPEQITKLNAKVNGALFRIAGKSRSAADESLRAAASTRAPIEAAEIIFKDPAALSLAKSRMTKSEFQALSQANIQNIVAKSSTSTGKTGAIIDGDVLSREIASNRTVLDKHYGKDVIDRLENLAVYAKAHNGIPVQFAEAPVTAGSFLNTAIAGGGLAGASTAIDPTGIGAATVAAGSLAAAWIFNPRGLAGIWLTTGLVPESIARRVGAEVATSLGVRSGLTGPAENFGKPAVGRAVDLASQLGGFGS